MFINKKFILASSSKSRYKILKQNNLNFIIKKPTCNEELIKKKLNKDNKTPIQIAKQLSKEKAKSVSINNKNQLVVGCDTIIIFHNKIINKATNLKTAQKKIKKLAGKEHDIVSAISIFKNKKQIWNCYQKTKVKIRKLSTNDINYYLKRSGKQILQSTGCYQIENLGPNIIENIKGDFFNVMGFPLFPFLKFLKQINIKKQL